MQAKKLPPARDGRRIDIAIHVELSPPPGPPRPVRDLVGRVLVLVVLLAVVAAMTGHVPGVGAWDILVRVARFLTGA